MFSVPASRRAHECFADAAAATYELGYAQRLPIELWDRTLQELVNSRPDADDRERARLVVPFGLCCHYFHDIALRVSYAAVNIVCDSKAKNNAAMAKLRFLLATPRLHPHIRKLRISQRGTPLLDEEDEVLKAVGRLMGQVPRLQELSVRQLDRSPGDYYGSLSCSVWLPTAFVRAIAACETLQSLEFCGVCMTASWPSARRWVAKPRRFSLFGNDVGKLIKFLDVFEAEHLAFDRGSWHVDNLLRSGPSSITSLALTLRKHDCDSPDFSRPLGRVRSHRHAFIAAC